MTRGVKVTSLIAISFCSLAILHVWLNIGFANLGLTSWRKASTPFRVGFLPVT